MALAISLVAKDGLDTVQIGTDITVQVVSVRNGKVKLAITAPKTVKILREQVAIRDAEVNGLPSSLASGGDQ